MVQCNIHLLSTFFGGDKDRFAILIHATGLVARCPFHGLAVVQLRVRVDVLCVLLLHRLVDIRQFSITHYLFGSVKLYTMGYFIKF